VELFFVITLILFLMFLCISFAQVTIAEIRRRKNRGSSIFLQVVSSLLEILGRCIVVCLEFRYFLANSELDVIILLNKFIFYNVEKSRKTYSSGLLLVEAKVMKREIVFTAYIRCEGRVTIPKELRDAYELKDGDLVECNLKKIR